MFCFYFIPLTRVDVFQLHLPCALMVSLVVVLTSKFLVTRLWRDRWAIFLGITKLSALGVAPSIASALSEFDAANLVGMPELEYSAYMQDKAIVSRGYALYIKKSSIKLRRTVPVES